MIIYIVNDDGSNTAIVDHSEMKKAEDMVDYSKQLVIVIGERQLYTMVAFGESQWMVGPTTETMVNDSGSCWVIEGNDQRWWITAEW